MKNKFWRKPLNQDQLTLQKGELHIIVDRCKGCGFCEMICPEFAIWCTLKENE